MADGSLRNFSQSDPIILDYIRKYHLTPPSNGAYNLTPYDPNINKDWTDPAAPEVLRLLGNKTNGFFIECGANDGEFLSSTLTMEMKYGWTGLLIEADPEPLEIIPIRNRKAWVANVCLANESHPLMIEMVRYRNTSGYSYMKKFLHGSNSDIQFKAQCFPLFSMLSALNVTVVDYLSLDINGGESDVLKTFPFDGPILIKVISAEVNGGDDVELKKFLGSKGYRVIKYVLAGYTHDLIFAHQSVPDLENATSTTELLPA